MLGWLIVRIRSSLAVRLALLTAGLLSLATVLIGTIIFTVGRHSLEHHIQSSLTGLAVARCGGIAGVVEQDYERAALVASRTRLRECLLNVTRGETKTGSSRAQMVRILNDAKASVAAIRRIEVLDRSCHVVVHVGDEAAAEHVARMPLCRAGMQAYVHGAWYEADGVQYCDVYGPMRDPHDPDGEAVGVIRTTFTVERLLAILSDYTGLGKSGELVLGMHEGDRIRIVSPARHRRLTDAKRYLADDPTRGGALRRAAAGESGFVRDCIDDRGERVLAAYMPVQAGDYYLVAKIDVREAFAPIYRLALWGGIGGAAVILIGLFCAVAFARLLVRPIRALGRATQAISVGDFAHRVPVFGTDETGRLAESFNHMVARIKEITASRDELDREVQERKRAEADLAAAAEVLQDKNDSMTEDLNMARDIQAALLPRKQMVFRHETVGGQNALNFVHFYRPSLALGGDFFQVIPLSDHSAAAVVCDVMGHGVRAALVTAIFRGLLEEQRQSLDDPAAVLGRLNRGLMTVLSQPEQFTLVSAACLVFDLQMGRVACANAGHPMPLLVNRSAGSVAPLGPGVDRVGPALGTDANPVYEVGYHPLNPDDRFLLYTDGLFEVCAPGDESFLGQAQFTALVAAHATDGLQPFVDGIVEDLEGIRGGVDFDDDLCLLAIELGTV
ncbi:MAG: SpoIIE family protein phosphatase [Verrucomicrobia bacterium]|jgi:serine phosphatase RsbU (regulator of sigma subunit)|nr:SpoIIE family protein phosphatase [Verrucomicrobiota bacterium]MBT7064778.1 SpoIIE family protein phosphatase [Verrucomicrobiota bacterium]MBT7700564.1 SpoIIE family protein phosphatase [Verrucomicrobiota bacterium]